MLKSILSVFGGAFGMIMKVMLCIFLVVLIIYCLITMFTEKFFPDGIIRAAGIVGAVLLFRSLIRPSKDE